MLPRRYTFSAAQVFLMLLVLITTISSKSRISVEGRTNPVRKYYKGMRDNPQQQEQQQRQLQKNNDDVNNKQNEGKVDKNAPPPTTVAPTEQPTLAPITPRPTPRPTRPPTVAPHDDEEELTDGLFLNMDDLRDIQYFGGGGITLRLSLWFQDGTLATEVTPQIEAAVLQTMQQMLCMSDEDLGDNTLDSLGLTQATYDIKDQVEERELCLVKTELVTAASDNLLRTPVEGSILLQPPMTYIVDQEDTTANLYWTTWRITWPVLRLGTFYILQGLENTAPLNNGDTMSHEDIYRAGVQAMQQVLELALKVSIREQSYDKLLMGSMVEVGHEGGMVLASVYGEEVDTLEPKLQFLGISQQQQPTGENNNNEEENGSNQQTITPGVVVDMTSNENTSTTTSSSSATAATSDAEEEDDDDDDRYSDEYGITENLDPDFWHPLRIIGILMFFATVASLVALSRMSKKRLARRERERKMAKEGMGLLNNPQGVEDMLRASGRTAPTTSKSASHDEQQHPPRDEDSKGSEDVAISMPNNLKMSKS